MTTPPGSPDPKQFIAGLFDRVSETYDSVGVDYFTPIGRRLVALAGLRPGDVVLDVGCGRGAATFAAAEAVGKDGRVVAIDLAPGMVSRTAAEAAARGYDRVEVRVGDAERPDLPEGTTFDAVLCALVIFFLPDPMAALRNYRALLRDGGTLALSTFPPQGDTAWGKLGEVFARYVPERRPARPDTGPLASPEALAEALREAGFASSETVTEPLDTGFRDLDHWWQWTWSHGQRAALERVPEDELPGLQAELYDLLSSEVEADGSVRLRQYVTYTVATA